MNNISTDTYRLAMLGMNIVRTVAAILAAGALVAHLV